MSSLAYKEEIPRSAVRRAQVAAKPRSSALAQAKIVREAKKLFKAQLAQAPVKMTRPTTASTLSAFEKTMLELVATLSKMSNGLDGMVAAERKAKATQSARRTPTSRLFRAMANADKIERGRYASVDEMIDSFGKTSKK